MDVAVDLGIKWVSKQAGKNVSKKLAQEVANDASKYDFPKTKPKKGSTGKGKVRMSGADAARIAGKLAREAADELEFYDSPDQVTKRTQPSFSVDGADNTIDPFYNTSISFKYLDPVNVTEAKWLHFAANYIGFKFVPVPYKEETTVYAVGKISGNEYRIGVLDGGSYNIKTNVYSYIYPSAGGSSVGSFSVNNATFTAESKAFEAELRAMQNAATTIVFGEQMIFPKEIAEKVYKDGSTSYPSANKLPDRDIEFPLSPEIDAQYNAGDEIEYEVLIDNSTHIENYIDTYIENYNVQNITNNYNTYNYYYDVDYTDIEQEEGDKVTDIDVIPPDKEEEETPPVPGDEPDRDNDTLTGLFTKQFPFSLPWDLLAIVDSLDSTAVTPHFKMDISGTIAGNVFPFKVDHKMDYLDPYIPFVHWFFRLSFLFMLVMTTRKLLGGGA